MQVRLGGFWQQWLTYGMPTKETIAFFKDKIKKKKQIKNSYLRIIWPTYTFINV